MPVPAALLILLLSPPLSAQSSDIDAQATRLAALRSEVEALSDALALEKDDLRGRLRAVEVQKVDLEVQIRREELRLERLLADEEQQRALLDAASGPDELAPVVLGGIAALRDHVAGGLPFAVEERLGSLSALEQKLRDQELSAEQASARLWAFAEDERRLTRENALGRQVIPLGGADTLVETARIGMIALYYRTPEGTYGQALPSADGWTWAPLAGAAESAQVAALFEALGQGVRTGHFTLPDLLAGAR